MAIFKILYHENEDAVFNSFKDSKVRVLPISLQGDTFTKLNKLILKDKILSKVYKESTIIHRVKRKKEREEQLDKVTVTQIKSNSIHSHYNGVRYTIFLPIKKQTSRLQYMEPSLDHLLSKAREFNSINISIPFIYNAFDSLKIKDVMKLILKYEDNYPAFINIYINKNDLQTVQKILKKSNIVFDTKEIKV